MRCIVKTIAITVIAAIYTVSDGANATLNSYYHSNDSVYDVLYPAFFDTFRSASATSPEIRIAKSKGAPSVLVPETSNALLSWGAQPAVLAPEAFLARRPEAAPTPELIPAPLPAMPQPPSSDAAEAAPAVPPATREIVRKASRGRATQARIEHFQFGTPTLAPFAHTRFCQKYAADCRSARMIFRPGFIALSPAKQRELARVNAEVNRAIRPTRVNETVAGERWLISPASGDCNDYAVTKRHELLAKGWPARALLLAEVVTNWGEHHLVLVVRTRNGDLVTDNLNANIRTWNKTDYQWLRAQSPANPKYWSTVKAPQADVVAMAAPEVANGRLR